MQPEISRRCLECGAAPRAGAHFCPQCGSSLSERGRDAKAVNDAATNDAPTNDVTTDEAAGVAEVARAFEAWRGGETQAVQESQSSKEVEREAVVTEPPPPTRRDVTVGPEAAGGALMEEPPAGRQSSASLSSQGAGEVDEKGVEVAPSSSSSSSSKVAGAVGATRRRAASVVKESIAPRVERVRDRSIVMLEDAPPDTGLRFVVIAAALFALFVLMLVLSTVIK